MKKVLLIITIVLLVIAVPVTVYLVKQEQDVRQKAAPATTLYFEPASSAKQVNDEFMLNIMIDTGENNVSAAELHLNYDAQYLEMIALQAGDFLTTIMESPVISNGTASISISKGGTIEPKIGIGILAKVTLKALADTPTPTQISFSDSTIVTAIKENVDVVVSKPPAIITIGNVALPTPSPSANASASPGTSPSPGSTPLATPNASPQISPSPSSQLVVTKIITPANGSSTTNVRQPISGTSFNNALMSINISTNPVLTSTFNATATGSWSYTPTADMAVGTYNIVLTATNPANQVLETVTGSFTVTGTGGAGIATPTPAATPSPTATPASTPAGTTPQASPASSTTAVPTTGSTLPTAFLLIIAVIFLTAGILPVFFLK